MNPSQLPDISACGTIREVYLEFIGAKQEEAEELWARKLELDARVTSGACRTNLQVVPDIQPFVSPVDKSVINSRKDLREHNRVHNVTNVADFTQTWEKDAKIRQQRLSGQLSNNREHIAAQLYRK